MNHPIAMIPYANMAPFFEMGPPRGCYFVNALPRNSIQALKSGAVWAAAVPVGGLDTLDGVVEPLGQFGIAAHGQVMSVLFFSDTAFDDFAPPRTVRLTGESASSVRLLYLLMGYQHGFHRIAPCVSAGASPNGELVIGDTALKWAHAWETNGPLKHYRFVTDLARLWDAKWQLPFVFARWVVRRDAPRGVKQQLGEWLEAFSGREAALIERAVPKVAARLALPPDYVRRYLQVIRRCLSASDISGLECFQRQWQLHAQGRSLPWFETREDGHSHE